MSTRTEAEIVFYVGERRVVIKAMDAVGPEDAYETQMKAVMHEIITGEHSIFPYATREVKDFMLRTNLSV
jgi:ribosomal protein L5